MTLLEFARPENSDLRVDNWMTRILSRKLKGVLGEEHFVNHNAALKIHLLLSHF